MLRFAVIFGVIFAAAFAEVVKYQDCGSVSGKITQVQVSPCPNEPCDLKHNTNITADVTFTSDVDSSSFKTVVHGIIAGVPVPFPLPNGQMSAAITKGSSLSYTNLIFVSPTYPKISLEVKWEVQDANGKDLLCFVVPAMVSD